MQQFWNVSDLVEGPHPGSKVIGVGLSSVLGVGCGGVGVWDGGGIVESVKWGVSGV